MSHEQTSGYKKKERLNSNLQSAAVCHDILKQFLGLGAGHRSDHLGAGGLQLVNGGKVAERCRKGVGE